MMIHSQHNEDGVLNRHKESSGCYSDHHASFMHEALGNIRSWMANWLAYGPSRDLFCSVNDCLQRYMTKNNDVVLVFYI